MYFYFINSNIQYFTIWKLPCFKSQFVLFFFFKYNVSWLKVLKANNTGWKRSDGKELWEPVQSFSVLKSWWSLQLLGLLCFVSKKLLHESCCRKSSWSANTIQETDHFIKEYFETQTVLEVKVTLRNMDTNCFIVSQSWVWYFLFILDHVSDWR